MNSYEIGERILEFATEKQIMSGMPSDRELFKRGTKSFIRGGKRLGRSYKAHYKLGGTKAVGKLARRHGRIIGPLPLITTGAVGALAAGSYALKKRQDKDLKRRGKSLA